MIGNGSYAGFAQYEMRSNMFFDEFESEVERELAFIRGRVECGVERVSFKCRRKHPRREQRHKNAMLENVIET